MKQITLLLALLAVGWSSALAAPASTNSATANRVLLIDRSSMVIGIGAGKATLTIGPLECTNGVYTGDYKLTVFPWFLNNENGRLAILISDETIAEAARGKVVTVTGTAIAKGGIRRPIVAIATPNDKDHGTLNLWFMAGSRKMIFTPAYHFAK
jgi:hypothetical protein